MSRYATLEEYREFWRRTAEAWESWEPGVRLGRFGQIELDLEGQSSRNDEPEPDEVAS